jgi:hypothetical protein
MKTFSVTGRKPLLALLMRRLCAIVLLLFSLEAKAAVVLTTLYSFTNGTDGASPNGLVQGSDGYF